MLRKLYTLLLYLIQPLLFLLMLKRSVKLPVYRRRLNERYGYYANMPPPTPNGIVIHAASVGEVIAATPLVKAIQSRYPKLAITMTTVTPTGSARVKAAFGDSVTHLYLPYDLPFVIKRFLKFTQPKLFIVIETELWPNLIRQIKLRQIPFMIANARLSPRSAKRYAWLATAVKKMLNDIDLILAQDNISAERYLDLGFPAHRLVNTGNLKFDLNISNTQQQLVNQTKQNLDITQRTIWIAASTHDGEEKIVLEAHKHLLKNDPNLLLILVPRHPERFDIVAKLIDKMALSYQRRSDYCAIKQDTQVLLGDTMGEMMLLYGLAKIAFVGGSLVKHGGHNPLEPIAFRLPVISGMYTFNFPEVFGKLREVNGVVEITSNTEALSHAVSMLLSQTEYSREISQAGFTVLQENQGALSRHLDHISRYIEEKTQ